MSLSSDRFFIHNSIARLADSIRANYGNSENALMLFPSRNAAEMCVDFLCAQESSVMACPLRIVELAPFHMSQQSNPDLYRWVVLYAVIYPAAKFKIAKAFWQHTGLGISSRRAEFHPKFFVDGSLIEISHDKIENICKNDRLDAIEHAGLASERIEAGKQLQEDLKLDQSKNAKLAIRARIARSISSAIESHSGVQISDVYLYETGMSAIFSLHRMLLAIQGHLRSVCYGYDLGWLSIGSGYNTNCDNILIPAAL